MTSLLDNPAIRRTILGNLLVVCMCLSFLACDDAAVVQAPNTNAFSEWHWEHPLSAGNVLRSVWARSASDVFAVGSSGVVMHMDGAHWQLLDADTSELLRAVDGDTERVVVVGNTGLCLFFDGVTWVRQTTPTTESFRDVWIAPDRSVFCVGNNGVIVRFDGTSAVLMTSGVGETLRGIHGRAADDVYAVGDSGMIIHYDGVAWSPVSVATQVDLYTVWVASGDASVAVAGDDGTVVHFDGIEWREESLTALTGFRAIDGRASDDIRAVGTGGWTAHFDGAAWTASQTGSIQALHGIALVDDARWVAVGASGTILDYDGMLWTHATGGLTVPMTSVWANGNQAFVVGLGGAILNYNVGQWIEMTSGTSDGLHAVSGLSNRDVYAVGDNGVVLHYNGVDWQSMESGTSQPLWGVWAAGDHSVYAVGSSIYHFDGQDWSEIEIELGGVLRGVWGSSEDDVYAVGDQSTVVHFDGQQWNSVEAGGPAFWYQDVAGFSKDLVYLVGEDLGFLAQGDVDTGSRVRHGAGVLLFFDGTKWEVVDRGIRRDLLGFTGSAPDDAYAVGSFGFLMHFDGSIWAEQNIGTVNWLRAASATENDIFVVGDGGSILRFGQ